VSVGRFAGMALRRFGLRSPLDAAMRLGPDVLMAGVTAFAAPPDASLATRLGIAAEDLVLGAGGGLAAGALGRRFGYSGARGAGLGRRASLGVANATSQIADMGGSMGLAMGGESLGLRPFLSGSWKEEEEKRLLMQKQREEQLYRMGMQAAGLSAEGLSRSPGVTGAMNLLDPNGYY